MTNLAELLDSKGHEVTQIAIRSPKQLRVADLERAQVRHGVRLCTVPLDTSTSIAGGLRNLLFSSDPYHVSRHWDPGMERLIHEHLKDARYDVIQFESIFLLNYLPAVRRAAPRTPIVLRAQNVEHRIWQGLGADRRDPMGWYLRLQAKRIEHFERARCREVGHIMSVTSIDAEWFASVVPSAHIRSIPIGLPSVAHPSANGPSRSFFHLAAMDWLPNREGVRWFMRHVWPAFQKAWPDAELHLAGTGMPADLMAMSSSSVHVGDRITDPVAFMTGHGIMVVPLLSGSGIRVKILEGMRLGRTIISTPQGASGIDCRNGHDILLASTPSDLIGLMSRCMHDPGYAAMIGRNARDLAERRYSADRVSEELEAYYRQVVDPDRAR